MAELLQGETGDWEIVIGIEIHAQVTSKAKLFSGASTEFGAEPNTQVSLVDAAMPGMLPVINRFCVEQAVRTGLGLKARINRVSIFDRKNYFYPDLPQGYQISQFKDPIVGEGIVTLDMPDGSVKEVGIERLHLEQDAGKSLHDQDPNRTFVDLNRAGVALMEIVSKPDMRGADEAGLYLEKLRSILRYLGTCDGNMEQGSMRADVNVSVRRPGEALGTRCEIKNVNSIRFVKQAIAYEAARQIEIIEDSGEIVQETRLFDADKGETRSMRTKEEAHDYRYFPDPDLLPLELEEDWIAAIKESLPELPDAKKERFVSELGLDPEHASVLVADKDVAVAFEESLQKTLKLRLGFTEQDYDNKEWLDNEPQSAEVKTSAAANTHIIVNTVSGLERNQNTSLAETIRRTDIAGVVALTADGTLSGRMAKEVLEESAATGESAKSIVEEKGLKQITDTGEIEAIVDELIANNDKQVQQYRDGNTKVAGWFVGQVMKATQGKANPKIVNELLQRKLGG